MTDTSATFTDDDLQATQIGSNGAEPAQPVDTRSRQQKAADTRRARREAEQASAVRPDMVIPPGGFQGSRQESEQQTQKEKREAAQKKKAQERRDNATKKVRYVIDAQLNPTLATVARMAIGVPPQVPWLNVVMDEETGEPLLRANGAPRYTYQNGAQFVILQPMEQDMICFAAPFVMEMESSERAKELAKKIAPYAIGGGLLVLGIGYVMRLAAVKNMLADNMAAMRRVETMEGEAAQQGTEGEGGSV